MPQILHRDMKKLLLIIIAVIISPWEINAQELHPTDLEFRRQAVQRILFDKSQDIPLAGFYPSKIVALDVMHPTAGEQLNNPQISLDDGKFSVKSEKASTSTRWVGAFNPYALYTLEVNDFSGSGETGFLFQDSKLENRLSATLVTKDGIYTSIRLVIIQDGKEVEIINFELPKKIDASAPVTLRVQMVAVGVNLYIEGADRPELIGRVDFVKYFDLRKKELAQV